jgi:hypothetical protein
LVGGAQLIGGSQRSSGGKRHRTVEQNSTIGSGEEKAHFSSTLVHGQ